MKWSKTDINHIKVSRDRCDAQGLANELGTTRESIVQKINEIEAEERLVNITLYSQKCKSSVTS